MREGWIIGGIFVAGIVALFFYERNQDTNPTDENGTPMPTIPSLLVSPVTDTPNTNSCTSKTDAQGNWYGVDISGNCTINALGGAGGEW